MINGLSREEDRRLRDEMFKKGLHWCAGHKTFHPIEKFRKSKYRRLGYEIYCRDFKQYYVTNIHKTYSKNRDFKIKLIEISGGCCQRCGWKEYLTVLSWHHVEPTTKVEKIAQLKLIRNWKKAVEEADKCCLLCANCHGAITNGELDIKFVKRNGIGWTVVDEDN
jgi:hypothetical protein